MFQKESLPAFNKKSHGLTSDPVFDYRLQIENTHEGIKMSLEDIEFA